MLQVNLGLNFPGSGNKKEEKYCLAPTLIEKVWLSVPWHKAPQRAAGCFCPEKVPLTIPEG